jgi:inorganic pyrophosphatase
MSTHPWHDVPHASNAAGMINAIIEIPKGSRAKYEIDKPTGLLKLDRVLFSSVYYPANYGFIPQSFGDDNDPLDILVLSQIEIVPCCIVYAKVIGVMRMIDGGLGDDKIIAVAAADPSVNYLNDISELAPHFILELRNFFENYTRLENKNVIVADFLGREQAFEIILNALSDYNSKFKKS